jgi:hypothetical protein
MSQSRHGHWVRSSSLLNPFVSAYRAASSQAIAIRSAYRGLARSRSTTFS